MNVLSSWKFGIFVLSLWKVWYIIILNFWEIPPRKFVQLPISILITLSTLHWFFINSPYNPIDSWINPATLRRGCSISLIYKIRLYFKSYRKSNLYHYCRRDYNKLFVCIHYNQKISKNCSHLGSKIQIMMNPAKGIFEYRNPYIFLMQICIQ